MDEKEYEVFSWDGINPILEFNEENVRRFIDASIIYFWKLEKNIPAAKHYAAAYQRMRVAFFGELLQRFPPPGRNN